MEEKEKTTASIGLCVRASGAGLKVLFVQFAEGRHTNELRPLETLGVTVFRKGEIKKFIPCMNDVEKAQCREAQAECCIRSGACLEDYDLIVLDEVINAVTTGMVDEADLISFLKSKPEQLEVALTGRDAPQAVRDLVDYISDIHADKHPCDTGIQAREGIEFLGSVVRSCSFSMKPLHRLMS